MMDGFRTIEEPMYLSVKAGHWKIMISILAHLFFSFRVGSRGKFVSDSKTKNWRSLKKNFK